MLEFLSWLGVGLQMSGLVLNGKQKMSCWPVWLASNAVLFTYFLLSQQWAFEVLQFGFVYLNTAGWVQWRKQKRGSKIS